MLKVLVASAGIALALTTACARPRAVVTSTPRPVAIGYEESGRASWYGEPYHGRRTASGEVYDMAQMTAAHRTLPFHTWILVDNLRNGRAVGVRINDRGPFADGRILDLSYGAARALDGVAAGVIPIRLRVIAGPAVAAAPPVRALPAPGASPETTTTPPPPIAFPTRTSPVATPEVAAADAPAPAPAEAAAPSVPAAVASPVVAPSPMAGASPGLATSDPTFALQLGSFTTAERAAAFQRELAGIGAPATIERAALAGRVLYRVRVGRFLTRAEAAQQARALADRGYAVLIIEQ